VQWPLHEAGVFMAAAAPKSVMQLVAFWAVLEDDGDVKLILISWVIWMLLLQFRGLPLPASFITTRTGKPVLSAQDDE
jgi:hypothetical protein